MIKLFLWGAGKNKTNKNKKKQKKPSDSSFPVLSIWKARTMGTSIWIQGWGDRGRRCILEGATAEDKGVSPSGRNWRSTQQRGPAPSSRQHPSRRQGGPLLAANPPQDQLTSESLCSWKMSSEAKPQVIQILWRPSQQTMGDQQRKVLLTAKRQRPWVGEQGGAFCQSGPSPYSQGCLHNQRKVGRRGASRFFVQRLFNKWTAGLVEKWI